MFVAHQTATFCDSNTNYRQRRMHSNDFETRILIPYTPITDTLHTNNNRALISYATTHTRNPCCTHIIWRHAVWYPTHQSETFSGSLHTKFSQVWMRAHGSKRVRAWCSFWFSLHTKKKKFWFHKHQRKRVLIRYTLRAHGARCDFRENQNALSIFFSRPRRVCAMTLVEFVTYSHPMEWIRMRENQNPHSEFWHAKENHIFAET